MNTAWKDLNYPIRHFQLMTDVGQYLKSSGIQMLEALYAYRGFGSWWFAFQIKGENYRIAFGDSGGTIFKSSSATYFKRRRRPSDQVASFSPDFRSCLRAARL